MSRRTQKVEIYLAIEKSGLSFFCADLGHIFGSNVGDEFCARLRGKGPYKPEFAVPENTEVVNGGKNIKTAAKSVGRQTLRKQLGEGNRRRTGGSRKRDARRVIRTKSAKQINPSLRDIFTNISHYSCRVIPGTNFLWQFLEILEGKSQSLMMSCRPMNKKSILLPHWMKLDMV